MTIILRISEERDATDKPQKIVFATLKSDESNLTEDINAIAGLNEYPMLANGIDELVAQIMKLRQEEAKANNRKLFKSKK